MTPAFDVVIVPDFAGPSARRFEALTLLFMAAWREHAGRAASFPLRVAAIGEPPASVRRLARQQGAELSRHEPLASPATGYANKLRALELDYRAERVLVLDADMLALGDVGDLAGQPADLMLATASVPRVPQRLWEAVYAGLGLPAPAEPMPCVMQEASWGWGATSRVLDQEGRPFSAYPYFNSGVLFLKRHLAPRLRRQWEEDMARIGDLIDPKDPFRRDTVAVDQTGLSTAVQRLRKEGMSFAALPDAYNARWHHLFQRRLSHREVRLFHAFRLAQRPIPAGRSVAGSLYSYPLLLWYRLALLTVRERRKLGRWPSPRRQLLPACADAWRVAARIRPLYRKYIRPVL